MARANFLTPTRIKRKPTYSDIKINFDKSFSTGVIDIITDEDAVKAAAQNIVLTIRGERFYNPDFGTKVNSLLFEPASPALEVELKTEIIDGLKRDGRFGDIDCFLQNDETNNAYHVTVKFSVINIGDDLSFTFFLKKVR